MTYTRLNPRDCLPLSGGTLTGNVTIEKALPYLMMKDNTLNTRLGQVGSPTYTGRWYAYDANDRPCFYTETTLLENGQLQRSFVCRRYSADGKTEYNNGFYLRIDGSGNPNVTFTTGGAAAWRAGLGLGTSGALPVTVAQGGTGSTGVTYTSTAADVFTPAAGVTLVEASMARWGKLVQVYVRVALATATGAGDITNTALGTLAVKPRTAASLSPNSAGGVAGFFANASGTVYVTATHAASTNLSFGGVYLSA